MCRRDGDLGVDLENWQDGGLEDEDELKCFLEKRRGKLSIWPGDLEEVSHGNRRGLLQRKAAAYSGSQGFQGLKLYPGSPPIQDQLSDIYLGNHHCIAGIAQYGVP